MLTFRRQSGHRSRTEIQECSSVEQSSVQRRSKAPTMKRLGSREQSHSRNASNHAGGL